MSWNESHLFTLWTATAVKSVAILGIGWMAAWALRRRSAAERHLVWTAAAAAMAALPLLALLGPALRLPVWRAPIDPGFVFRTTATASAAPSASTIATRAVAANPVAPSAWHPDWMAYALALWAAGASIGLLRMVAAAVRVARLRRASAPYSDPEGCYALAYSLGIFHPVTVLEAPEGTMPMTFGIFRPTVLMPRDAAGWPEERRRVVLLHELAHVRRGDAASHVIARIALSLNWWNPVAWTAWREFLKECECATDDLVLGAGERASAYAGHLLAVAREMQTAPAAAWSAIAMARSPEIEGRLRAILDPAVKRSGTRRISLGALAVVAIAAVMPLAAVQTQESTAQAIAPDLDATIQAANARKNHEILENAASAYERLRQFDAAQKLLESAAAIRAEVSGANSVNYGIGLVKLGELAQRRNQDQKADEYFAKAAQILNGRPESGPALLNLGIGSIVRKEYDAAFERFTEVARIAPAQAGPATMWMAVVRDRQQNAVEANALFSRALVLEGYNSSEAGVTSSLYARFLREQGRTVDASVIELTGHAPRPAADVSSTVQGAYRAGSGPLPDEIYRAGAGVTPPQLVYKREPEYTEIARAAKYSGTVTLSVEVGPDGAAHNVRVVRSLGLGLDEKAMDAVSLWKFRPGTKDGVPVTVASSVEVNFRLL